jgi:hypothetical protein
LNIGICAQAAAAYFGVVDRIITGRSSGMKKIGIAVVALAALAVVAIVVTRRGASAQAG